MHKINRKLKIGIPLIFALLFLISDHGISQSESPAKMQTNAEEFASNSGTLIEKIWQDVGKIKNTKVRVVFYTDLIAKESLSSLRFEKETYSSYSKSSDTKIASLDLDEVDGLIQSLEIISNDIITSQSDLYKEVTFKSRGGFEAGCFTSKKGWSLYLKLKAYDSKSYEFLDREDMPELIKLIRLAKTMM